MQVVLRIAALAVVVHAGVMASPQRPRPVVSAGSDLQAAINRARPGDGAFVDPDNADYRLRPAGLFRTAATDGSVVGADIEGVMQAIPSRESPGWSSRVQRR